ncbi:MAG: formylglycine-generating enzyme family protein, partial [Desulfobacterales bacterium]|nr:formylglycine-generating enzyme family protein [Desulfobacterales bacterium]
MGDHDVVVRYVGRMERKSVQVREDEILQADFSRQQPEQTPAGRHGMVFVQGGSFQMGSDNRERGEYPAHKVTVSSFFIGKYEVTQGEYEAVMGAQPFSDDSEHGDDYPVYGVNWVQAAEYCNALSLKEGLTPCYDFDGEFEVHCDFSADGYRLPTEAEWEFAARGGNVSRNYAYPGGNDLDLVAWYRKNTSRLQPVGRKRPNELGLFDMAGNVGEWCWDWFGDYGHGSRRNPTHPAYPPADPVSIEPFRVVRGGSDYAHAEACRVTSRFSLHPELQMSGFRLVRREFKSGRLEVTLTEPGHVFIDGREIGLIDAGRPVLLE